MKPLLPAALAALLVPAVAYAQDEPRFCPNRPDLGASGCTTEPGHVQFEVSSVDWQRDDSAETREDVVLGGNFQARIGLASHTEVGIEWTPFGRARTRDKATGAIERVSGVGDARIDIRQSLSHPDGEALSIGVEPFVTVPFGRGALGEGDWGAGVVLPLSYDVGDRWNLNLTFESDAAVDEDRSGRHLAYSGIVGVGYDLSDSLTIVGEVMTERDHDPSGHETHVLTAGSIAWQPRKGLQLDVLTAVGLNRNTPDVRVLTGGTVLF